VGFFSDVFQNYREQDGGSGLQTLLGSSALTGYPRGYDEDRERKWRERFGTGQERTNLDAPQTGLSAAQINLKPGFKGEVKRRGGWFGPSFFGERKTNNPAEVAGLGNVVSDPDGSMFGTDSSPAIADYMLPQEQGQILKEEEVFNPNQQFLGGIREGEDSSWSPGAIRLNELISEQRKEQGPISAEKLNQNIPGNIYAKHGGSVFRNAYDQASNIMYRAGGGGLEGLRESIDINGQPHNLAYINPSEANLLKVLGGSGEEVNGVPAYWFSAGDTGQSSNGDSYAGGSAADFGDAPGGDFAPGGAFHQGPEADAPGEGPGPMGPVTGDDPEGEEFGSGEWTDKESNALNNQTYLSIVASDRGRAYLENQAKTKEGKAWLQGTIDKGWMQGAGIPFAQSLEGLGLATFNKGMRSALEAYSPGRAMYRDAEAAKAAGDNRGYDFGMLTGLAGIENEDAALFRMYIEDADPKDTIEDVARDFAANTGRSAANFAAGLGFNVDSKASAYDISASLNESALRGMKQGLGMMANIATGSPFGLVNFLSQSYTTPELDDKDYAQPQTRAMTSYITGKVLDESGITGLVNTAKDKLTDFFGIEKGSISEGARTAKDVMEVISNPIAAAVDYVLSTEDLSGRTITAPDAKESDYLFEQESLEEPAPSASPLSTSYKAPDDWEPRGRYTGLDPGFATSFGGLGWAPETWMGWQLDDRVEGGGRAEFWNLDPVEEKSFPDPPEIEDEPITISKEPPRVDQDKLWSPSPDTEAPDSYSSIIAEIRKRPPVEEDLTEEEEEEKKSIADLVGLEGDIVERLSLQNVRNILKDIYGPDYEPF